MKIKRIKGFSLAEVLISLTVVSLVMAAAAPVLTKKTDIGDVSWQWTNGTDEKLQNGTVFNRDGIIIGDTNLPKFNELMKSEDTGLGTYYSAMYPQIYGAEGHNFIAAADELSKKSKISIIKNRHDRNGFGQNFVDSHIALYNLGGSDGSVQYVGKLASDQYNLAFGLGALQSLNSDAIDLETLDYDWDEGDSKIEHFNYNVHGSENTAIGHYAMAKLTGDNRGGNENVAMGYNAMFDNQIANQNTAVGYNALAKTVEMNDEVKPADISENTVVGNFLGVYNNKYTPKESSTNIVSGAKNVIIGNYSQKASGNREFKSNNIIIGHDAGNKLSLDKTVGFNTGKSKSENEISNVIAIDDIVQIKQGTKRKVIINGDFTIRTIDGRRAVFKVDGSGHTINVGNSHSRMTLHNENLPIGPDRCEDAEICIGKFNVPVVSNDLVITTTSEKKDLFDVYIKGMAVAYDGGSYLAINGVNRIPFLGAGLTYLDRYKDTNGAVINFLNWLNENNNISQFVPNPLTELITSVLQKLGVSDVRLKNVYGDSNAGLKEIEALKIKNYVYKADKSKTPHVGVIAQELQKIFPNSVHKGSDGYLSITQEEMFYGLVKSIQELSAKNNQVEEKIALTDEQIKITNEQNNLLIQENKLLEKQNKEFAKRIAKLQKTVNKTN